MTEPTSRRALLASATSAVALPTSALSALAKSPGPFDVTSVAKQIAAIEDCEIQDAALSALSAALKLRFSKVMIHDWTLLHAIDVLEMLSNPNHFFCRIGAPTEHYAANLILDFKEALTGFDMRPKIERDGVPFAIGTDT